MGRGALVLVVLAASACPHRDEGAEKSGETAASTSTSTRTRTSATPPAQVVGPLKAELRGVVVADGIGISLRAAEAVEVSPSVQLIAEGSSPQTVLTLRLDCRSQGCVKLAAGAELLAPPWLERPEAERCDALFRPTQPGEYRLRVQSCDGGRAAEARVRWAAP